ncbi:MAG: cob(I)yrinic acid a,c-diamide adenosyltransferase [Gammaproteobacteria bacterium]|nr:cob(I)yrinic acid a,c-diamide adenosyltransferase [Gammaproteobacteria bacterium]MDE2250786.1 cob(I)yrinic acid a,c-diamide adenosyltransferase [Gammaproteobacteria bacterium]
MGHRLSKIVTRTGDDGTTGLADGSRVPKESARIEACGAVDELNSALGVLLAADLPAPMAAQLLEIQHDLFDLGGELAIPGSVVLRAQQVEALEHRVNEWNADLPALREFVLPGGGAAAAHCHLARSICRRAERRCWALSRGEPVNPQALRYLNRLSDLLFVLARVLARRARGSEVMWRRDRGR